MNFYDIKTTKDLATYLGYDLKNLTFIAYGLSDQKKYNRFEIKKRNGKDRCIFAPCEALKNIQNKIKIGIEEKYRIRSVVHGFVKNKSIITNAKSHIKKKYVINIDLKDFFPTINFGRVRGIFIKYFKFTNEVSTLIAQLLCFNNELPQGSPCSPLISNIITASLDKNLYKYAKRNRLEYTRYVDDMTFSTDLKKCTKKICTISNEYNIILNPDFENIIKESGFVVNVKKLFLNGKNRRQQITGLVVNEKVNFKKEYINSIRSILHHCHKDSIVDTAIIYNDKYSRRKKNLGNDEDYIRLWFSQVLKGKLLFAMQVCPKISLIKYCEDYNILFKGINRINFEKCESDYELKQKVLRIIDKDGVGVGSAFCIKDVGIATCYHVIENQVVCYYIYKGKKHIIEVDSMKYSKDLDIAILPIKGIEGYEIKDRQRYVQGQKTTVVAYPNADINISMEEGRVLTKGTFFGQEIYKASQRIVWGMSGGVVLDKNNFVCGMCRQGENPEENNETDFESGFIPGKVLYDFIKTYCK